MVAGQHRYTLLGISSLIAAVCSVPALYHLGQFAVPDSVSLLRWGHFTVVLLTLLVTGILYTIKQSTLLCKMALQLTVGNIALCIAIYHQVPVYTYLGLVLLYFSIIAMHPELKQKHGSTIKLALCSSGCVVLLALGVIVLQVSDQQTQQTLFQTLLGLSFSIPLIVLLDKHLYSFHKMQKIFHHSLIERVESQSIHERQAKRLELFDRLSLEASTNQDKYKTVQFLVDEVCTFMQWPVGHVYEYIIDKEAMCSSGIWHIESGRSFDIFKKVTEEMTFKAGEGMPGRMLMDQLPAWHPDVFKVPYFKRAQVAKDIGVHATFAFPVISDGTVTMVIEFFSDRIIDQDQETINIISRLSTLISLVTERDELHKTLERKVLRRTVELEKSKVAAEESNRLKSEFIGSLSHELRTPMNGVVGMTELLSETSLTEKQNELLTVISQSANNLSSIISDLIDFSSLEAGDLKIIENAFSIDALVTEATNSFQFSAESKNIGLVCFIDSSIPNNLIGPEERVKQVLMNLIGNAIKFTDRGNVKVKISCVENNDTYCRVLFRVIDSGIGLSEEEQGFIFDKFRQVDGSYSREKGGLGLGLSITQKLCDLMGSEITVESEQGKGSVFSFELKLKVAPELTQSNQPGQLGVTEGTSKDFSQASILLVEDNDVNRLVANKLLAKYQCKVTQAINGVEAVESYKSGTFDLILMDCQMPKMDGLEATRQIRDYEREQMQPRTPIVALTANATKEDEVNCYQAGMDDFVAKPLKKAILAEKLSHWL